MSNFLDFARVNVKAGKGGDGMVAFRREKYVPDGGPAGGDGGKGGSVIFRVDEGLATLRDFRYNRHFKAKNGENGMSKSKYGADADDLYVKVPPGTIVRRADDGQFIADLVNHGQIATIAKGGRGGRGNIKFATHKNPAPSIAENGEPGEEFEIELELKLIADVALVGLPSVGKSTLLSVISNAKPKIADYHFTTLEPNLGLVRLRDFEYIVADMPGLIEGASEGIGLGIQFLKHIERSKVLIHVIDISGREGRDPFQDFLVIMNELEAYHRKLIQRPMVIAANKIDLLEDESQYDNFKTKIQAYFQDKNLDLPLIVKISAWKTQGVNHLIEETGKIVQNTEFIPLEEEVEQIHYTLEKEEDDFVIEKIADHHYLISGTKIEKLFAMTNMAHDESIARFSRQMRGMGIDDALRNLGAQEGDIIELSTYQFEFMD